MAINEQQAVVFPAPPSAIFAAAPHALASMGLAAHVDPARGVISASTSVSLASWGETMQIVVQPLSDGSTMVTTSSSLKFGLIDWGKNGSNIARFHQALAAAVGQQGAPAQGAPAGHAVVAPAAAAPAGGWHPDPSGRHQLRWWDGARWGAEVCDGQTTGHDPI